MKNKIFCLLISVSVVAGFSSDNIKKIENLSDDFNDPGSIGNWERLCHTENYPDKVARIDINKTEQGCLYVKPRESKWREGYHGPFLYKEINGDFVATIKLKVTGAKSDYPNYPKTLWQIAGIMARIPQDLSIPIDERKENWIFNTYGSGFMRKYLIDIGLNIENSFSCFPYGGNLGWTELCIVRIDNNFITLSRSEGEEWRLRPIFTKPEFPAILQVGLITCSSTYPNLKSTYSYEEYNTKKIKYKVKPDLSAVFEYAKFMRPSIDKEKFEEIKNDRDKLIAELGL